jgi:hypothetical protein
LKNHYKTYSNYFKEKAMNKKSMLIGMLVLFAVLVTSAFSWATGSSVYASQRALTVDVGSLNAADVSAYRWSTLDQKILLSATSTGDLRFLSAADVSAYRWNAMAKFYTSQSQAAADLSAYRWNAMAQFYAPQTLHPADLAAYRWNAQDQGRLLRATSGFYRMQVQHLFTPPGH